MNCPHLILSKSSVSLQASAAKVPEEEATYPGEWPGIYACDVRNLLDIYVLTALAGDRRRTQVMTG